MDIEILGVALKSQSWYIALILIVLFILLAFLYPLALIYGLNVLFGANIAYNLTTFVAVYVFDAAVSILLRSRTNKD